MVLLSRKPCSTLISPQIKTKFQFPPQITSDTAKLFWISRQITKTHRKKKRTVKLRGMLFPKALGAGTWWGHQEEPGTRTSCHPNVPLGTPLLVPRAAAYPTAPTSTQRHRLEGKGTRGPCSSRHSSAQEDSRSPITTSTGNTPTTGNCFLSMEIQHNPSL